MCVLHSVATLFPYTTLFRSKREGLVTVGYDVMDSPLSPLWIAVGPRGVVNIHYGPTPDPRELAWIGRRSEEHTSELQSLRHLVCRLLLEKKTQSSRLHQTVY